MHDMLHSNLLVFRLVGFGRPEAFPYYILCLRVSENWGLKHVFSPYEVSSPYEVV